MVRSGTRACVHMSISAIIAMGLLVGVTSSAFATVGGLPTPSAGLPDGRAYEMVSPPAKNGGDVLANSQRTRAAADGSALMFSSLTPFGDALGTGVATEYIAQRSQSPNPGSNGWDTHAVTPPQTPESFLAAGNAAEAAYQGEVSADLTRGAIRTFSPLTDAPNAALTQNLYLRSDLRAAGAGSYQLLDDCLSPPDGPCSAPLPAPFPTTFTLFPGFRPWLAGASTDFSHVLFETSLSLTNDAPLGFAPKLYEYHDGVVRLAGILPDSACGSPPCLPGNSVAGQGAAPVPNARYTPHTISANGTRIFFTADATGCGGGSFICGELYMRSNNGTPSATSVQLNASERTPVPDPTHATATYWDASSDGSRVFFTTQEALTDTAPVDTTSKLYMYDASLPDTDPHNLTLLNVDNALGDTADAVGVIGASDDGHYVYFVNSGQLVAGKLLLNTSLGVFLWHDGTVSFVGQLTSSGDAFFDDVGNAGSVLTFVKQARVSADGRTLLFSSTVGAGMLSPPYDQGGHREFYIYRADTDQLSCASCTPSGATGTADASAIVRSRTGGSSTSTHLNRALSENGRYAFFSTAEPLVTADSNGKSDAYEYDTLTGTVSLLSSGKDPADSYFLDASTSGDDAFILTRQRSSKWDTDQNYDVYDVRMPHLGHPAGFPDPPKPAAECSGDQCHGSPSGGQPPVTANSAQIFGFGNVKAARAKHKAVKCKRGFVRKRVHGKVRCVRKPKPKPKHHAAAVRARTRTRT